LKRRKKLSQISNFNDYLPEIITGITGMIGIIIGVFVTMLLRIFDIQNKKRENNLQALKQFYIPLCQYLKNLDIIIKQYKNIDKKDSITVYLSKEKNQNGKLIFIISKIEELIPCLYQLIEKNNNYFIGDYKLQYCCNYFTDFIQNLKNAMENKIYDANLQYKPNLFIEFQNRVFAQERQLMANNLFHRVNFKIWRFFKDK